MLDFKFVVIMDVVDHLRCTLFRSLALDASWCLFARHYFLYLTIVVWLLRWKESIVVIWTQPSIIWWPRMLTLRIIFFKMCCWLIIFLDNRTSNTCSNWRDFSYIYEFVFLWIWCHKHLPLFIYQPMLFFRFFHIFLLQEKIIDAFFIFIIKLKTKIN